MIDEKTFDRVAQFSHYFSGLSIVLTSCLYTFQIYIFPAFIAYAGIKEFYYDQKYEPKEIRGSNLEDFLFQFAGALSGLIIYWIKIYFVK